MKLLLLSLSFILPQSLLAHPMDAYVGCYDAITINGAVPATKSTLQSTIVFNSNTDGQLFGDPKTNKGIPYYKININSGYLVPDTVADPIYYWTNVFADRGEMTKTETSDQYFFNDQINFFPKLPNTTDYLWWLYSKIDISKTGDVVNLHLMEDLTNEKYDPTQGDELAFDVVVVLKPALCK